MEKLEDSGIERVIFFEPDELFFYLENEAAREISNEVRIKGYKVKVNYQPVSHTAKKTKKEMVTQVIFDTMRRMKGKN